MEQNFDYTKGDLKYILKEDRSKKKEIDSFAEPTKNKPKRKNLMLQFILLFISKYRKQNK